MRKGLISTTLGLSMLTAVALPAAAEGTLKIAYIDPLSGGGASIGQLGLNQLKFIAEDVNAKGGVNGEKVEIVPYDNKLNPQVTLVQVQKAIDEGVRIIVQGNGSSVAAAVEDFVTKYNDRNPGKEVIYLNYAAIDPVLTNAKCSYWHFAWDASSDIKVEAVTNFLKGKKNIKKVYLIDQDYSFGHAVADAAVRMLKEKRPDIEIVGNEFHPLVKVTDFSPYVAKIKASGADTVITGNWGQDFALLIKAAADAGLKVDWYTFYAGGAGGPTAIKQANDADHVFQITEGFSNLGYKPAQDVVHAYADHYKSEPVYYPRVFTMAAMLFKAVEDTKSDNPVKIAHDLEGMKFKDFSAGEEGFMRKDDHQFYEPLYISSFGPLGSTEPFDEEHTGWGWRLAAQIPVKDTIVPTTCKMKRP
ncbi:MAG TPA: branched-chain amino acid ABC transporter substrate-binding protein [Magnetospirillaceae bacterium]